MTTICGVKITEEDKPAMMRLVIAVRKADEIHQQVVGGGTKHWVRDCLLPCLEDAGLAVIVERP